MEGVIYKGIGGFYYVKTADGNMVECKPRGIFRKTGQKPLAGDRVRLGREADTDYIDEILPRGNALVRPPVANVDLLFVVASTVEPVPSSLVIDKLMAAAIDREITPVLVITKADISGPEMLEEAYETSGIQVIVSKSGDGAPKVQQMLPGRLSVFCGNSGVGKSTLLNALLPQAAREVAQVSHKLGRGRHTTREVEIFEVAGGLVADTPGFASFDVHSGGAILADNLQLCFPEIRERIGQCKFSGCTHVAETGCAVRRDVQDGLISQSRYNSYVAMYKEARENEKQY